VALTRGTDTWHGHVARTRGTDTWHTRHADRPLLTSLCEERVTHAHPLAASTLLRALRPPPPFTSLHLSSSPSISNEPPSTSVHLPPPPFTSLPLPTSQMSLRPPPFTSLPLPSSQMSVQELAPKEVRKRGLTHDKFTVAGEEEGAADGSADEAAGKLAHGLEPARAAMVAAAAAARLWWLRWRQLTRWWLLLLLLLLGCDGFAGFCSAVAADPPRCLPYMAGKLAHGLEQAIHESKTFKGGEPSQLISYRGTAPHFERSCAAVEKGCGEGLLHMAARLTCTCTCCVRVCVVVVWWCCVVWCGGAAVLRSCRGVVVPWCCRAVAFLWCAAILLDRYLREFGIEEDDVAPPAVLQQFEAKARRRLELYYKQAHVCPNCARWYADPRDLT
jgi:hypothetical protein